jgi:hypothetical protein
VDGHVRYIKKHTQISFHTHLLTLTHARTHPPNDVFFFCCFVCFFNWHPDAHVAGIVIAIGVTGPAVAFALGGIFSRIYVTLEGKH